MIDLSLLMPSVSFCRVQPSMMLFFSCYVKRAHLVHPPGLDQIHHVGFLYYLFQLVNAG